MGYDRDVMMRSLESALWLQALVFRHIAEATIAELGDEGRARLVSGLREYGRWRGRELAKALPEGATAAAIALNWNGADLRLPIEKGYPGGGFRPAGNIAEISITESPQWTEWRAMADRTLARLFFVELLAGIAEGYGRGLVIEHPKFGPDLKSLWTVRLTTPAAEPCPGVLEGSTLDDEGASRALLLSTNRNFAALYYYLGRAVMRGPSLSGEKAFRAGTRTFGVDRGERLRARHIEEGREINLRTMQEHLDLPAVSLWEFKEGETEIIPAKMFKTCTFCPYMGVWQGFEDGPVIGYLYDFEFHLAQYQAYLPGTVVEFDGVKTLGDAVCRFRFQMPGEVSA